MAAASIMEALQAELETLISQHIEEFKMDLRQKVPFFMNYASGYIDTVSGTSPLLLAKAIANSLQYVKAFGGTQQGLPAGYTQLLYIESAGSGYIDTGIVLKTFDLDVECDLQFTDTSGTGPAMTWGFMGSSSNLPRWGFGFYTTGWLGSANATSAVGTKDTDRHTAILSTKLNAQNQAIYEGIVDSDSYYGTTITSPSTFEANTLSTYLFARNNNGTAGNNASCKIYGFKVRKAGVLIHYLIPCKNANNVVGMYNLVTNTFIAGSGTLIAGQNVVPTPDTPVDIVSNNGVIRVNSQGQVYTDGAVETIEDTIGNTATAEMLLKVSDYQDQQEILAGAVTRNIGVIVLDGTEDWTMTSQQPRSYYNTMTTINANTENELLCSHFKINNRNTATVGGVCVRLNRNGLLFTPGSSFTTLTDWQNYLVAQYNAGTPVIVLYPLETPTTESVTGQTLQVDDGDNTLEITQASLTGLELEAQYKRKK